MSWWARASGASARHAMRALARWFSAVRGCPRRRSAFPPSAATTRISHPQRRDHDGLDRVEAVLGLVEDDRRWRLEDFLGHLERFEPELVEDLLPDRRVGVVE